MPKAFRKLANAEREAARDSKNPTGPVLRGDLPRLLSAINSGRLDR